MRIVKVEDLRKEIEICSQNHEREVDRKDAIIQMLDRDLEESEEQHQMALRSHLQVVDRLLELHAQRSKALEHAFELDLSELHAEFAAERAEIDGAHAAHSKELVEVMTLMEREYNEAEDEARQETDGMREEIKNRNAEDYNMLRDTLERVIKRIEEDFDTAYSNYTANTEARTHEFKHLTSRDQQSAKTIDTQTRRLQRLQDNINHWRAKIASNARECEQRNAAMREEKESISKHYQDLKGRMAKFRDGEARRLQELTLNSRAAIKSLSEKLGKSEAILKLGELNRKLETEREKVRARARSRSRRAHHAGAPGAPRFASQPPRIPSLPSSSRAHPRLTRSRPSLRRGALAPRVASRRCCPSTSRRSTTRPRPRSRSSMSPSRCRRRRPAATARPSRSGTTSTTCSSGTTRCCSTSWPSRARRRASSRRTPTCAPSSSSTWTASRSTTTSSRTQTRSSSSTRARTSRRCRCGRATA
jgi:hypothetical protein